MGGGGRLVGCGVGCGCFKLRILWIVRTVSQSIMRNRQFRVNYYLEALQTRTNPLFSRIKASLLAEGVKRLIRQAADFTNNQVAFRATICEDSRTLAYDSRSQLYSEARTTILLEFDAEGRFIKLGEASIDLGSILNSGRNGQLLTYRVEKCYDRNARLTVAVDLSEEEEPVLRELKRHEEHVHSRSHCQLPPGRAKIHSNYEPNRCHATEYSNLTDLQMEEQFSMTSDHRISRPNSHKRSQMETLGRTEVIRPPSQMKLQQELLECRSHIAQSKEQIQQLEEECEELRSQLSDVHAQNYQLLSHTNQLKTDIAALEGSKEAQREAQAAEVSKYLKLYQESEMERNRLLLQLEQQNALKVKEQPNEDKNKLAAANRSITQLQSQVELLQTEVEQLKTSNSNQQKTIDEHNSRRVAVEVQLKELNGLLERQRGKWEAERKQLLAEKEQAGHELQVGRFSLKQLQRQVAELRILVEQKAEAISRSESELKFANQAMRQQRRNYTRRLQQLQMLTEREQHQAEQCLEQLQIKTIHQNSRNHTLQQLKQENAKVKRQLLASKEKNGELQEIIDQMEAERERLQGQLQTAESRVVDWARERAQLEKQIQATREHSTYMQSMQSERSVPETVDREEIMAQCYEERDLYWREEIEHLERDTKILMDKARRDREHLTSRLKQTQQQLEQTQQQLAEQQNRVQQLESSELKYKKTLQEAENKAASLKTAIGELESELTQRKDTAGALKQQIQLREEAENSLTQLQTKHHSLNKQLSSLKQSLKQEKRKMTALGGQIRQICVWTSGWLTKGDKQKLFFEPLRTDSVDAEMLSLLNTSIKTYCDRHNKLKIKLEELEEVKAELESRERENDKLNKSMRNMRRSQGSCDSHFSESSESTTRLPLPPPSPALKLPLREDHDAATKAILRREVEELKGKLKKESSRMGELERTIEQQCRMLEQGLQEKSRLVQEGERRSQQVSQLREKLRLRQKQLQSAKEEGRELLGEVNQLKLQLEQVNRQLKMEKSQLLKRTTFQPSNNRSFQLGRNDDTAKMAELQRKCRAAQEEADKLRRERDERKGDNGLQSKQYKLLESRIREKETALVELRKEAEEERQRSDQQREINNLKLRKLKEEFEEEVEAKAKAHRELQTALEESEEKVRQITKRSRLLEEQLKQAQLALNNSNQRENKAKQLIQTECELKLKAAASDHQAELQLQKQLVEQTKAQLAAAKEQERRKERELMELKSEADKKERRMTEMSEQLELYGLRVRNLEEEENKYQMTIGSLEKRIKVDPVEAVVKTPERSAEDEVKSNFSLRTFTFR